MIHLTSFANRSILLWLLLSLVTATFMPITADEALYYVYGLNLDWGFHDHPPMVALMTALGNLFPATLLVRLPGLLGLTFAFWLGSRIVAERNGSLEVFHFGWWMMPILHVYGIVITPDVPLLILTMGLWWVIHKWIQEGKLSAWLIVILAGLMYSKYHAAIVIAFALFPMKRFWNWKPLLYSALAFLLFVPHLFWQYTHDWDTFRYHFVDRKGEFTWGNLGGFVAAQLGVFNPVLWFITFRLKIWTGKNEEWINLHRRIFFGLIVFFTLMVTRGRAEAHWAVAGAFSLLFLLSSSFVEVPMKSIRRASMITVIVFLLGRIPLVFPIPIGLDFWEEKEFMAELKVVAKDRPVAFMNSYSRPSEYMFYHGVTAHSVNNISGGLCQYQVWQYDTALVDRPFLWIANYKGSPAFDLVSLGGKEVPMNEFRNYQTMEKLWFDLDEEEHVFEPGLNVFKATLINRSLRDVDLTQVEEFRSKIFINYKKPGQMILSLDLAPLPDKLLAGESVEVTLSFELPEEAEGDYWFKLSLSQKGIPNYINSNRCFFDVAATKSSN